MADLSSLKVGDKIVELGHVYRIFKVKDNKIYFKPFFKSQENNGLVASIPKENIKEANIRKPITRTRMRELLKKISEKRQREDSALDVSEAKDRLKSNRPMEAIRILKRLWQEKHDEATNFTKSKKDTFELAIDRLAEEFALVGRTKLGTAREKIEKALPKLKTINLEEN